MDFLNLTWLLAFVALLVTLNVLDYFLIKYVNDKPLGHQSLYDVVFKDTFVVVQAYGTTYCTLAILSRLGPVSQLLSQDCYYLGSLAYLCYTAAFTAACVNVGLNCVIRTFCLISFSFMEETVGENLTRMASGEH